MEGTSGQEGPVVTSDPQEAAERCGVGGSGESLVSEFDYSVNQFFEACDAVSSICGESLPPVDGTEMQRLLPMVTFLTEWKSFNYQPRTVTFAFEGGDMCTNGVTINSVQLPQFSSACPRKKDAVDDISECLNCNDFVLHAGGSVWALDWCPRAHQTSDSYLKCEYLAVAAHPPDSSYHQIGHPLMGRGLVQIWCVVNKSMADTSSYIYKPKKQGQTKKRLFNLEDQSSIYPNKRFKVEESTKQCSQPGFISMKEMPFKQKGDPRSTKDPTVAKSNDLFNPISLKAGVKLVDSLQEDSFNGFCISEFDNRTSSIASLSVDPDSVHPRNILDESTFERRTSTRHRKPNPKYMDGVHGEEQTFKDPGLMKERRRGRPKKHLVGSISSSTPHSILASHSSRSMPLENCVEFRYRRKTVEGISLDGTHSFEVQEYEKMNPNRCEAREGSALCLCDSKYVRKDVALPRLVLCLAHMGKVAWDVKWRPLQNNIWKSDYRMGYLAALLGNGSIEVWEVPLPGMVKALYSSFNKEGADPRFVRMNPVFRCSQLKCGNKPCIPLVMEWSPSAPCDLILAGCHDGTVAMWKFSATDISSDTKPLLCFNADSVPIRAISWAPDESDTESSNLIVTAGGDGLKLWDLRDPYFPLLYYTHQKHIMSVDWLRDPRWIMLSYDDGFIRFLNLSKGASDAPVTGKPSSASKIVTHSIACSPFAIWSAHVSRATGIVAYCGVDGRTNHFELQRTVMERNARKKVLPSGSLLEEGQNLIFKIPDSIVPLDPVPGKVNHAPANPKNSDGRPPLSKSNTKAGAPREIFPPKLVAMHKVRWNTNRGSERWLCYGGAAGIVRCQEIPVPDSRRGS